MEVPVCRQCLYVDAPCIRCSKTELKRYTATELGVVCNSCSKYFRDLKQCSWCNQKKTTVANRHLESGVELICGNCYTQTLPLCSECKYRREPFIYAFNKNPICKICALEETRYCKYCDTEIASGTGHICLPCKYLKTFEKRSKFGRSALSPYLANIFSQFCGWLKNTRSTQFAAENINVYFLYFVSLDKLANSLNRLPTYEEIVHQFTVAETRKNLLVTMFLDQENIVCVDQAIKDEYSNIDSIERYLNAFDEGSFFMAALHGYYDVLYKKLNENKTSTRSIRLALTPAVKLLRWCVHYELNQPTNELLRGFLWVTPGHKAAVTGFVGFLNRQHGLGLELPEMQDIELSRPTESRMQLKQRFVTLLRNPQNTQLYRDSLIVSALNYLHGVAVPKYAWVSINSVKNNEKRDYYIRLVNQTFFLPNIIFNGELSGK
ncbi:hypothetical protein [Methylobacter tundripaludum]|nr:hypothetical protein [Methylobacter tundripaludum]